MKARDTLWLAAGLALGLVLSGSWVVAQPDRDRPTSPPHAEHGDERSDPFDARERLIDRRERWADHLDEITEILREINPQVAERLEKAEVDRPGAKLMIIRQRFPEVLRLAKLREEDPAMYSLRVEDVKMHRRSDELGRAYREARKLEEDRKADDILDELEALVEEHFDLRQEIREVEIERLESRIDALRDALDQRKRDKNDLIDDRLDKLTGRDSESRF